MRRNRTGTRWLLYAVRSTGAAHAHANILSRCVQGELWLREPELARSAVERPQVCAQENGRRSDDAAVRYVFPVSL